MANGVASFKDVPNGYLAAGDPSAVQTNFFAPGAFSPELLNLGYTQGQPVTIGELLTVAAETTASNPLTGPVLIITGGESNQSFFVFPLKTRGTAQVQKTLRIETNWAKAVIYRSAVEIAGPQETHLSQTFSKCRAHTSHTQASLRLSSSERPDTG